MKKEFVCQQCGKKFIGRKREDRPDPKYCSRKCKGIYRTRTKKQIKLICKQCGKEFIKDIVKNVPYSKYCSIECSRKQRKQEFACLQCGKTFKKWNSQNTGFCSTSCSSTYRKKFNKGRTQIEYICPQCNTKFYRRKKNPPYKFCSQICNLVFQASHRKFNGTKPELKCKDILEKLSIQFEYQSLIRPNLIVDFLLPNKIILQIDGEYWHGHPRFNPLTQRQLTQIKRDISQDKYFRQCGYKVFRIWADELSEEKIRFILSSQFR